MADPATLLIADDDPGLRESLERTLTREGYRVVLASDGRAALELALAVYHSHAHAGKRITLPMNDRTLTVPSR